MKYRCIATDLDGTLLDDSGAVPEEVKRQIARWQDAGGLFTIATGRSEKSAQRFVDMLGVRAPVITSNGATVVDAATGRTIFEAFLDPALARELACALHAMGKDVIIYMDGLPCVLEETESILRYTRRVRLETRVIRDPGREIGDRAKKLLVIDRDEDFEGALALARRVMGDQYNVVFSNPWFMEVMPAGTSKGEGLRIVARALGVPLSACAAVGDQINDLPMLEAAGLGVAVANAPEGVRARAGFVAPSNDEGGVGEVCRMAADGTLP